MSFIVLVTLMIFQRLNEISLGNRNWQKLQGESIFPLNQSEKKQMMILHTSWFISSIAEYFWHGEVISAPYFLLGILLLIFCQYLRFQSIKLIGPHWTQFPVAFNNQKIIQHGPYQFIKHPNYLAVIIELLIMPLMGTCYLTAIMFTILNILFLKRRIDIEENALSEIPEYQKMRHQKKLIPYLYVFLLFPVTLFAASLKVDTNHDETYFKFLGESTKFGLVTTGFEGYANKGELQYEVNENKLSGVQLTIAAKSLDTDNSMRNEKMWEQSLEAEKYPHIVITTDEIDLNKNEQIIHGTMNIRNKKVPLEISLQKISNNSFKGTSKFKFTKAGIPDPSIAIAKVRDEFDIEFKVTLP